MEMTAVVLDDPGVTQLVIYQCFKFGAPYLVPQIFGAPDMAYSSKGKDNIMIILCRLSYYFKTLEGLGTLEFYPPHI
eukprot:4196225-Ditylum_brightwellii.AAC.1